MFGRFKWTSMQKFDSG